MDSTKSLSIGSAVRPLAVDTQTAARMLSLSRRTIQNYIAGKVLPSRKIGRRTVILVRALEKFLRADHPSPSVGRGDASSAR
jgi:excisionase family DNA binding protein